MNWVSASLAPEVRESMAGAMARKLRIQFPGARYHVINRGNYQHDVFRSAGAVRAFERALVEACTRFDWLLHAYAIMRNHYHLALETPAANLVEGMHWLQSTFATRYNGFRDLRGHVFQGRYHAPLIEDATALVRVIDYIHLNPVRAGIVAPMRAGLFQAGSLPRMMSRPRPPWLQAQALLDFYGLRDSRGGWAKYLDYLGGVAADPAEPERRAYHELATAWAIGTPDWRKTLARRYARRALEIGLPQAELREIKEQRWQDALDTALSSAHKTLADAVRDAKGAAWKIALAVHLRRKVGAPYRWIAAALNMGTPGAVRVNVWRHC